MFFKDIKMGKRRVGPGLDRPLLSLQTSSNFPKVFRAILDFHLEDGDTILDPTPGEGYSWSKYLIDCSKNPSRFFKKKEYKIVRHTRNFKDLDFDKSFDAIFFDPPYIFGAAASEDDRRKDYGDYHHSLDEIRGLFEQANYVLPNQLKKTGKLFVKYTDVFSLKDRTFYLCVGLWTSVLSNFKVVDHYIIQHHHLSPTAWQVKNRPCGICNYTYLTVFELR